MAIGSGGLIVRQWRAPAGPAEGSGRRSFGKPDYGAGKKGPASSARSPKRRPVVRQPVGNLLKWEGIVIDPIEALLAVLVFETILLEEKDAATGMVLWAVGKTAVLGGFCGVAAAIASVFALKLSAANRAQGELLEPVVYMVILGTVTIYSILGPW